jgi:YD repeat-containing protein
VKRTSRVPTLRLENPYERNGFNQLLAVTGPSGTTSFGYDGNGNQVSGIPDREKFRTDRRSRRGPVSPPASRRIAHLRTPGPCYASPE